MPRSVEVDTGYTPQPKQERFHACPADEVFYGGAAGGGKSYALLNDGRDFCLRHPNIDAVLFRRTFPQLEMYHINVSRREWPASIGKYNASKYYWQFANGSRLLFRALKNPGDEFEYQTAEFPWIGFDELTHFLEDQYTYLISRNRSATLDPSVPRQVKSASNPGNIGHAWVKRRFVTPSPPNTIFVRTTSDGTKSLRCFIPAKIQDNPALMKNDPLYYQKLKGMRETEKQKLLYGNWDIAEGAAFGEWNGIVGTEGAHVIKPFTIPPSWKIEMCMDWGYSRPFWIGWIAWNFDDRPHLVREWYGCRMEEYDEDEGANKGLKIDAVEVAKAALKKEGDTWRVRRRIGPSDIWEERGHGSTIGGDLIRGGFNGLVAGNRAREAGKLRFHELLKHDDHGEPYFHVFENCRGFIRTFPDMILDDKNPEDVNTDGEDHPYDGCRYGLMAHDLPFGAQSPPRGEKRRADDYGRRRRRRRHLVGAGAGERWKTV